MKFKSSARNSDSSENSLFRDSCANLDKIAILLFSKNFLVVAIVATVGW